MIKNIMVFFYILSVLNLMFEKINHTVSIVKDLFCLDLVKKKCISISYTKKRVIMISVKPPTKSFMI